MNKTLALALLLSIAVADRCDPWIDDCTPQADMPQRRGYIVKWWLHGILNWFMAVSPLATMAVYAASFADIGVFAVAVTWGLGGLNLAAYLPVAILWIFSVLGGDKYVYRRYRGWLVASNIYGWFLSIFNIGWYVVLMLYMLGVISVSWSGSTPSYLLPIVGAILELIFQTLYSVGYGGSVKLMKCWGWDYPQFGYCDF